MSYAETHTDALATITEAGAEVAFTMTQGTYDPVTDTYSGATNSTVPGHAVQVKGSPIKYQALGLVQSEAPTLLFAPTTFGELPALGSQVAWNSTVYTVRDVDQVSPDGVAIIARVVVVR